ncbi:response regulator [Natronorubrum thiooxidans]|uniref:Response regulator receiver domain-containing protein n=1 Tax=Natronorubrum thiooxidans TaxID=308853 RepID=A0A1N7FUQ6_9EURY|nr:response regulator [Natronorubrum thiooxidans]SIS04080.1 Response regulator receiver domain-containing protein [Natronorubrum thiooxidans]
MVNEVADPDGHGGHSSSALFDVLSNPQRRTVLFHLRQQRAATLEELVDVIAELDDSDGLDPEHVRTALLHAHVPKLVDNCLVTYDPEAKIVESDGIHNDIGEWLDLAVRHQIRFDRALEGREEADRHPDVRVLLVDDEPGLAETVGTYVERENDDVTVTTATSTAEAVTTLEGESFDCIVSDYEMPGISGLDFLKVVREEDASIPFIVFTARGSETIASRAIATGVTDYVQKGPDTDQFDELVGRIRTAVDRD